MEQGLVQLCGRFVVRLDGQRIEERLPGRKGRLLFAYLVLNRAHPVPREELLTACWGADAPPDAGSALSVTLSKLRSVVGAERLAGRSELQLVLPHGTRVDVESASEAAHHAELRVARGEWAEAWGPACCAVHIGQRPLLVGMNAEWIEEWRRRMEEIRDRGLECLGAAALGLGGTALNVAEKCARQLVTGSPYRESGYRLLMEALTASGNTAEALRTYDTLRVRLRDELGIAPDPAVQDLHSRLLAGRG